MKLTTTHSIVFLAVFLWAYSLDRLNAGLVTTTPAFQTTSGHTNYLIVKKSDVPTKVHIHWDHGTVSSVTVTASPSANATIASDPSNADTANDTYKIITLTSSALGLRTGITINLNHTGSASEACTTGFSFVFHIFEPYLEEISFGGTKNYTLTSDDAATTYSAPQWKDVDGDNDPTGSGEKNYATAYEQGTIPKIGVKIKMADTSYLSPDAIKLEVTGPGSVSVPATAVTTSGSDVSIAPTASSAALGTTIKYYDKTATAFALTWKLKVGSFEWNLPSSKHTVYQTLADPATSLRQETLFYIASRYADGVSSSSSVTSSVWSGFTGLNLTKADKSTLLHYYNAYSPAPALDTAGLLSTGDGECDAWCHLFLDALKVEGITGTSNYVTIGLDPTVGDVFFVQNWTFAGAGKSGDTSYPFLNIDASSYIGASSYTWKYADVTYTSGTAGQNQAKPASLFSNHKLVSMGGSLYDPSYGQIRASIQAVPIDAVAKVVSGPQDEPPLGVDLNGNGNTTDLAVPVTAFIIAHTPAGTNFVTVSTATY